MIQHMHGILCMFVVIGMCVLNISGIGIHIDYYINTYHNQTLYIIWL